MDKFISRRLKNIINISKVVTVHYFELSKDFKYCGETHYMWEMIYVDKGEVISTAGANKSLLKQGSIVFHKPNEFHNVESNKLSAPNLFIVTFVTTSKGMKYLENKNFKLSIKHRKLLSQIIDECNSAFNMKGDIFNNELKRLSTAPIGSEQLIRLYLEMFLILMIREQYVKSPSKSRVIFNGGHENNSIVSSIIHFLNENLYSTISINDVCRYLNFGKTYICTSFKQHCGYGIKEYYILLKINEAKRLLRETNHTVSEISDSLCFQSPQYFSKVFKKLTGMTPGEYKLSIEQSSCKPSILPSFKNP